MVKNFLIVLTTTLLLLIIIELFTGAYFFGKKIDCIYLKCNYKYSMRVDFIDKYTKKINYSRDKFGFRGVRKNYQNIDFLVVGGSTTEEKFLDDNDTWTEKLEKKFIEDGNDIEIVNAGIDGQSTIGHIYNFKKWFPEVKNLKPKFIIFYIGINEYRSSKFNKYDNLNDNSLLGNLKFYLKRNNGLFVNLYRKVNLNRIRPNNNDIVYHNPDLERIYLSKEIQINNIEKKKFKEWVDREFLNRLNLLINLTKEINAIPIFVSQKSRRWFKENEKIYEIEYENIFEDENFESYYIKEKKIDEVLKDFTKKNEVYFISGFNEFDFKENFFYDLIHTNILGSEHISEILYPFVNKIYYENF